MTFIRWSTYLDYVGLGSLDSYLISLFPTLLMVPRLLEFLRVRFFRGTDLDERCMHWLRWDRVLTSKANGGLGVGSFLLLIG